LPTTVIWGFDLDKLARFFLNSPDMKTSIPTVLITFALVCFALVQNTQAVSPAPDGAYTGANTAEGGSGTLFSLTTGTNNTALGSEVLSSLTTGSQNTATGAQALKNNNADRNTADGFQALVKNTTASSNTATGWRALFQNTNGELNTATGDSALYSNTSGFGNTATGVQALFSNITGMQNTATGVSALELNIRGERNTANGYQALVSNTTGTENVATGAFALANNNGNDNTAVGFSALSQNARGTSNTAIGNGALFLNATGNFNTAGGNNALTFNRTGSENTAIGDLALANNTTGNGNTAIGSGALENNATGGFNTALGVEAGRGIATASNVICIGNNGAEVSNSCFIGNIRGVTTQNADAIPVLIDSFGQLGTASSSRRFKKEIKPMDKASEAILALKPVKFHYKSDKTDTPQFGLIAEEVAAVNPDLVVCDKNGEIYTVRYDSVNAMLLNEFLKEHRKVQEQEATITELKKDFRATVSQLTTRLDEQAAQIQKVSAQLEANKPAPQVVNNP
jgi:hypothetical protein